jgi:hypothetical protein
VQRGEVATELRFVGAAAPVFVDPFEDEQRGVGRSPRAQPAPAKRLRRVASATPRLRW